MRRHRAGPQDDGISGRIALADLDEAAEPRGLSRREPLYAGAVTRCEMFFVTV